MAHRRLVDRARRQVILLNAEAFGLIGHGLCARWYGMAAQTQCARRSAKIPDSLHGGAFRIVEAVI